ncbi:preprotein translocase subunit Tim44 [Shewanella sp. NFH-SH190041]|uniref:Tim44 domain-containing protein n=1 Tax=Shewanella sp. NFH-SH190041 TaxID=2950245 RepID=UPI0021C4812E|nr:Tim44-like domain-containing protein [Shewanella sp. NFH-SH190041]BDM64351.1 preprotein translocase subunit Tim44 [Shewanella sp. NFH-SH190041]
MKKFLTLFTLILTVSLVMVPQADAKRFGGGKSFGKSYKTAPAPKQQAQRTDSIQKQPVAGQKAAGKKGMMGGLLGGLLAGGLLAALFAGGAFDGIQLMDIIIIAIIAFIAFKLIRMLMGQKAQSQRQPAYAGQMGRQQHQAPQQPQSFGGGFSPQASDVPFNLPAGFDANGFINRARDHYMQIQRAWNNNDLAKIREYVSADIYQQLVDERAATPGQLHNEILFINAELVRADFNQQKAELSLAFSGRYRETPQSAEEDIRDIWHLERDLRAPNAPWLIVGIE